MDSHWSHLCSQLGHQAPNRTNHEWLQHAAGPCAAARSSSAVIYTSKYFGGDDPLKQTVTCQCSQEQTLSLCPKEMEQRDPKPPHQERIWASLFCSLLSNPSDFVFSELISISHHKSPNHVPRKIMPAVCGEFLMHFTISLTITALFRMERIILLCSFRMINCRILKDSSLNANNR